MNFTFPLFLNAEYISVMKGNLSFIICIYLLYLSISVDDYLWLLVACIAQNFDIVLTDFHCGRHVIHSTADLSHMTRQMNLWEDRKRHKER